MIDYVEKNKLLIMSTKILVSFLSMAVCFVSVSCMSSAPVEGPVDHDALYSEHPDSGYEFIVSDGTLDMFLDRSTGQFYIQDNVNDVRYYSNPPGSDNDMIANNYYKMNMKSQIEIRYLNPKLVQETINNFVGSINKGNYTVSINDSGFRFEYDFVDEGFVVPVEYYLHDNNFYAEIIIDDIIEYKDNLLLEVILLPYFAAHDGADDGYIVIPDGCGAVIDVSDRIPNAGSYSGSVYGRDSSLNIIRSTTDLPNQVTLPLFGIVDGNSGILAVIEDGDAHARIYASPIGVNTSFASAGASVTVRNSDTALLKEMTGVEKSVTVFNPAIAAGFTFKVAYAFLDEDTANYSAMAEMYSRRLFGNNEVTVDRKSLIVDLLMTVRIRKNFLIFPYEGLEVLLTSNDVREVSDRLVEIGYSDHIIKVSGWQKDSLYGKTRTAFSPAPETGRITDFARLAEDMSGRGSILVPGFDLLNIYDFAGSVRKNDAVRNVSGGFLEIFMFRSSTYLKNTEIKPVNVLNSNKFASYYSAFTGSVTGIFSMIADDTGANLLPSDNHRNTNDEYAVSRQDVMENYFGAFNSALSDNVSLMFDDPRGYALDCAHTVTNLPGSTSGYKGFSEEIPFVQMVLSGKVNYTGEPLNLAMDMQRSLLKMIEYGEIPYFQLSELTDKLHFLPTRFNENYSINLSYYLDKIEDISEFSRPYIDAVKGSRIIRHERIDDNIYLSEYSNGTIVYVNYGSDQYLADEITVLPRNYRIGGKS